MRKFEVDKEIELSGLVGSENQAVWTTYYETTRTAVRKTGLAKP